MEMGLGLGTIAIAGIIAVISYRNYLTSRDTLRLGLFEERFAIYKEVQRFLSGVLDRGTTPLGEGEEDALVPEALGKLLDAGQRARFMFGKDIDDYIRDEIYSHAIQALSLKRQYLELPVGPEKTAMVREHSEHVRWMTDQLGTLPNRFAPYLSFSTKGGPF